MISLENEFYIRKLGTWETLLLCIMSLKWEIVWYRNFKQAPKNIYIYNLQCVYIILYSRENIHSHPRAWKELFKLCSMRSLNLAVLVQCTVKGIRRYKEKLLHKISLTRNCEEFISKALLTTYYSILVELIYLNNNMY